MAGFSLLFSTSPRAVSTSLFCWFCCEHQSLFSDTLSLALAAILTVLNHFMPRVCEGMHNQISGTDVGAFDPLGIFFLGKSGGITNIDASGEKKSTVIFWH